MWQRYGNQIIVGIIVGAVVIAVGFLISTSWALRLFLMTAVLVGEGVYFLRVVGILGQSSAEAYRGAPPVAAPAQSKNMPARRGTDNKKKEAKETEVDGGNWQGSVPEQPQQQDAKSHDYDDEVVLGAAKPESNVAPPPPPPAPAPATSVPPAGAPVTAKPDPKPVPNDILLEETAEEEMPAEAEDEPASEIAVGGDAPADDVENEEDFFGTGVFDDSDIDLEAVEAYRRSLEENSGKDTSVHFSAYYPKEVKLNDWQPLHTYIYRKFIEAEVAKDAADKLGEKMASFRQGTGTASQAVAEGATIAVTPYLPGFQFNPPVAIIGFYKDWHRLDFEVRAVDAPVNQAGNGRITFTVEGVIVGDIPLSIFVGETVGESATTHATQKIYQAIFASYSHSDTTIVERVERAFKALGLDYLRDVTTLRSGQNWNEELLNMIDRADVFQLFWSDAAASSKYVRQEWEYALKLGRESQNFIRPVYWRQPMPNAPTELSHIHFAYQPDLDD